MEKSNVVLSGICHAEIVLTNYWLENVVRIILHTT